MEAGPVGNEASWTQKVLILGLDHRAPNSISFCFASLGFHFLVAHGLCARGQSHKDAPKKGVGAACPGHSLGESTGLEAGDVKFCPSCVH